MTERDLDIDPRMTYGDLRRYAETLDVTVCSGPLTKGINGVYDEGTGTIVIDRTLRYTQKRCTLVHELVHWSHGDDTCNGVMGARMERRTRRETATMLVSPDDYALAETMFDGDVAHIAAELDVTCQVVKDYRDMVLAPLRDQCAAL
jgi:Zn-dependent peptidase ImmA (M78 family)